MGKKFIFFIISICVTCLIYTSASISDETVKNYAKKDKNKTYFDFIDKMVLLTSLSAHYLPQLHPDVMYVGSDYYLLTHQDPMLHAKTEAEKDKILVDLKWELEPNWFMGIYSQFDRSYQYHNNKRYKESENPLDTDVGIIFIHKF